MSDTIVYRDNAPTIIYKEGDEVLYKRNTTAIIETTGDEVLYKVPQTSIIESQGALGPEGPAGGEEEVPYDTRSDHVIVSETIEDFYKGFASPGSQESSPVWRIFRRRITTTGDEADLEDVHADGVSTYTKVWNDRLTYIY